MFILIVADGFRWILVYIKCSITQSPAAWSKESRAQTGYFISHSILCTQTPARMSCVGAETTDEELEQHTAVRGAERAQNHSLGGKSTNSSS